MGIAGIAGPGMGWITLPIRATSGTVLYAPALSLASETPRFILQDISSDVLTCMIQFHREPCSGGFGWMTIGQIPSILMDMKWKELERLL